MRKPSTRWKVALAIVLLVAPWIAVWAMRARAPVVALIAVPADGPGLEAPVSAGFADAPYFVLVDLSSRATKTVPNAYRSRTALGLKAAHQLLATGIGVVLVRSMRPEPFNALTHRGVRVHVAPAGRVGDSLREYLAGGLAQLSPLTAPPPPAQPPGARTGTAASIPAPITRFPVPALGIEVASVPKGALVVSVVPGSRAARARLQAGDIILRLGQHPVSGADALLRVAAALAPQVHVSVALERNGIRGELWIPP